jgi:hypothetical protein
MAVGYLWFLQEQIKDNNIIASPSSAPSCSRRPPAAHLSSRIRFVQRRGVDSGGRLDHDAAYEGGQ